MHCKRKFGTYVLKASVSWVSASINSQVFMDILAITQFRLQLIVSWHVKQHQSPLKQHACQKILFQQADDTLLTLGGPYLLHSHISLHSLAFARQCPFMPASHIRQCQRLFFSLSFLSCFKLKHSKWKQFKLYPPLSYMSIGDRDSSFSSPVGKGKGLGDCCHPSKTMVKNTYLPPTIHWYTTDTWLICCQLLIAM